MWCQTPVELIMILWREEFWFVVKGNSGKYTSKGSSLKNHYLPVTQLSSWTIEMVVFRNDLVKDVDMNKIIL